MHDDQMHDENHLGPLLFNINRGRIAKGFVRVVDVDDWDGKLQMIGTKTRDEGSERVIRASNTLYQIGKRRVTRSRTRQHHRLIFRV